METARNLIEEINQFSPVVLSIHEEKKGLDVFYCIYSTMYLPDPQEDSETVKCRYRVKCSRSMQEIVSCLEFVRDLGPALIRGI